MAIEQVEITSKDFEKSDEIRTLSILGNLEPHNLIIHLKSDQEWLGLYGMKRNYRKLALHIDDKVAFKNTIECIKTQAGYTN